MHKGASQIGPIEIDVAIPAKRPTSLMLARERILQLDDGDSFLLKAVSTTANSQSFASENISKLAARIANWARSQNIRIAYRVADKSSVRIWRLGAIKKVTKNSPEQIYIVGEIEKGMPAPSKKILSAAQSQILQLKDGESFVLTLRFEHFLTDNAERLSRWAKVRGIQIMRRKIDDDTVRIWRVAATPLTMNGSKKKRDSSGS
ncbi:hypothetical protein [Rhodanobacter sp. L36]|uniref:hypothetical protein n=1 Tax=Rhodanobacter sp. L36 TaxID=1747221 RepID=UPI00131DA62B|nr:hypothetical protein [Rhodanobacter sp. L36]